MNQLRKERNTKKKHDEKDTDKVEEDVEGMLLQMVKLRTNLTSAIDMLSQVSSWESSIKDFDGLLEDTAADEENEALKKKMISEEKLLKAESFLKSLETSVSMLKDFPGNTERQEKLDGCQIGRAHV